MNMKKNKKGFTLMEMLIVVAIIAVLVAIAIPVLSNNLHKAKVAADWANVRALYANLQTNYMMTGEPIPEYKDHKGYNTILNFYNDGVVTQTAKLQTGYYLVAWRKDTGYQIAYTCKNYHTDCELILGQ